MLISHPVDEMFVVSVAVHSVQDAQTICTAEEAEAELPALKQLVMELLGELLKKKKDFDIDRAFTDKEQLLYLSQRLNSRAERLHETANGTAEALKTEVVLPQILFFVIVVHANGTLKLPFFLGHC